MVIRRPTSFVVSIRLYRLRTHLSQRRTGSGTTEGVVSFLGNHTPVEEGADERNPGSPSQATRVSTTLVPAAPPW
jgi:hypothetical protein